MARGPLVAYPLETSAESTTDLDRLARDLGLLVRRLLADMGEEDAGAPQVGAAIRAHLGEGAAAMPVVSEAFSAWDQANVQLALDAMIAREGWSARTVGISGQARHYPDLGLGDMMVAEHFPVGSVEHATAEIGPGRTLACIDFAVMLIDSPQGPLAAFVHRGNEHFGRSSNVRLQVAARERERPDMDAADLVLPPGVLERVERHLVGPSVHRERLLAMGRHLSRGLLLWGPPGTGKTHTVRYLTGRLRDATVIILSGGSLGAVGAFGSMARRLAPSVVILEDVDLVAEERTFGEGGSEVLFELMNQMSGLGDDADVAFVLTTNRPEALEPALAARPGRIDLAVEIPLPDAAARAQLLELYGRGLDLRLADPEAVIARTEGVTASFVKELLRKAALGALVAGREHVTDADVATALDELLSETGALTRVLLGAGGEDGPAPASGWLGRFPQWDEGDGDSFVVSLPPEP